MASIKEIAKLQNEGSSCTYSGSDGDVAEHDRATVVTPVKVVLEGCRWVSLRTEGVQSL